MSNSLYELGLIGGSVGGIGLIVWGFFKYQGKMMQIEDHVPVFTDLNELKKKAIEDARERGSPGLYVKVLGKATTHGVPLMAPRSRMKVVMFETIYKKDKPQRAEMPFAITDGTNSLDIDPKGATLFLHKIVSDREAKEWVLQMDQPLFVAGEVKYDSLNERMIIRKPTYGLAYIISAYPEQSLRSKMRTWLFIFYGSGTVLLLGGAYCGFKLVSKTFMK